MNEFFGEKRVFHNAVKQRTRGLGCKADQCVWYTLRQPGHRMYFKYVCPKETIGELMDEF